MRGLSGLMMVAGALVAALPSGAGAYYVEVRGSDSEAGVDRPIAFDDGDPATAETIDVEYRVNPDTFPMGVTGARDAIDAAFGTWSAEPCATVDFSAGPDSDSEDRTHWTNDMGDIYVLVFFSDDPTVWTRSPQAVGNFFWAHDGTGRLIGGTVILNSAAHAWATDGNPDRLDVQSIVTALIGRSLGITSNMMGNATYPSYSPGDTSKRMLGEDDRDAIEFLYPSNDMSCDAVTPPEAECPEITLPGDPECPPPVMTNPGDGGTRPPGDAGPMGVPDDGGMSLTDGGAGDASEGCSCRASAPGSPTSPLSLLGLGALWILRRRRRQRR